MTDVSVSEPTGSKILSLELRGKCGSVDVDPEKITDDAIYEAIFKIGLETVVNKVGMSKIATGITKLTGKAHDDAVAAVRKQAEENVKAIYAGTIKLGRGAAAKRSGAVNTEAMRLAKALVKDLLRNQGYKIGAFSAGELTEYAKEVLAGNPELYKKAEANLVERAETKVKGFDIKAMLGTRADDEELKAKPKVAPKPKKKGDKPSLSATQAGLVAPRQKPATLTH